LVICSPGERDVVSEHCLPGNCGDGVIEKKNGRKKCLVQYLMDYIERNALYVTKMCSAMFKAVIAQYK
jgi:hypothetical protein